MRPFTASHYRIGMGMLLAALFFSGQDAAAKVDVPYGPDGSSPDSEAQAEANAFNDALDGPKDGQTSTSWFWELKVAHDALYSPPLEVDPEWGTPRTGGATDGGEIGTLPGTEVDLCNSLFSDWVNWRTPKNPDELVSQALSDPALKKDVEFALEDVIYYQLAAGTAVPDENKKIHLEVERPTVSALKCSDGRSGFDATVPVKSVWHGVPLDHGSVSLYARATYQDDSTSDGTDDSTAGSWCIYVISYDIHGLTGDTSLLNQALVHQFCWPAHVPPLGGTPYP